MHVARRQKAIAGKLGLAGEEIVSHCTLILGSEQRNPPAPEWQVEGHVFSDESIPGA